MIDRKRLSQLKNYFATQPVDVVYLFGSQANGKATKISDIDIAVLFKKAMSESRKFDLRLAIISEICHILKKERVDVIDLEKAPIPLKYSAIAPKKEVYVRNNDRRVEFEAETTSRYFDEIYFIKQNTVNSLASIANMSLGGI